MFAAVTKGGIPAIAPLSLPETVGAPATTRHASQRCHTPTHQLQLHRGAAKAAARLPHVLRAWAEGRHHDTQNEVHGRVLHAPLPAELHGQPHNRAQALHCPSTKHTTCSELTLPRGDSGSKPPSVTCQRYRPSGSSAASTTCSRGEWKCTMTTLGQASVQPCPEIVARGACSCLWQSAPPQ